MSSPKDIRFGSGWDEALKGFIPFDFLPRLAERIDGIYRSYPGRVNPARKDVFRAFALTPYSSVKVVLLAQDPYPGHGVADGLAFSARGASSPPASLVNIEKELVWEFGKGSLPSFDLSYLARQGVFLYNTSPVSLDGSPLFFSSVEEFRFFSKAVVKTVDRASGVAFVLLGNKAGAYERLIDVERNLVLKAPHPSPLSARRGFFGSGVFRKANEFLVAKGKTPVDWLRMRKS